MAAFLINPIAPGFPAPTSWKASVDAEGHRTYKVELLVQCDTADGPATAMDCAGIPLVGSYWSFAGDVDQWAWRLPTMSCDPMVTGQPNNQFKLGLEFSTKPPARNQRRCGDEKIEDPLLEPPKINGTYSKYTEEAAYDRFGLPILSSSFEMLRGPQVEFDKNRNAIEIEQNCATADQGYILPAQMNDTVNAFPLWGLPPRCIKLSVGPWERVFYGSCEVYYKRKLTFDIGAAVDSSGNIYSTFDRNILDEGTKALNGHWDPDPTKNGVWVLDNVNGQPPNPNNPLHFCRYKDRAGENNRVVLNGTGLPAGAIIPLVFSSPGNGKVYICIAPTTGNAPPNATYWVLQDGQPTLFLSTSNYFVGAVVQSPIDDNFYVLTLPTQSPVDPSTLIQPSYWLLLPNGVTNGAAQYTPTKGYVVGDSVSGTLVNGQYVTVAGSRFVQKYSESDFTQLMIPLSF